MPATAGRVRMPANNRVHSSAALQTHGIWQSAIGYDPYAPNKDDDKSTQQKSTTSGPEPENAYASFQGLLALARITNSTTDESRGACKKCGRVGHLTYQCRNFLSAKDDNKEKDPEAIQADILSELMKLKGKNGRKASGKTEAGSSEESSEEEEESESSDSEYDSEMERIIAEKYGKKISSKVKSSKMKEALDDDSSDLGDRKKRGRTKKRRSGEKVHTDSDSDGEVGRRRRKEKRRKRGDESSDEDDDRRHSMRKSRKESRRRRSHRDSDSDDSDASEDHARGHKRKSRRATSPSDPDASYSEDRRIGRDKKRSGKRSRKHRHGGA